MPELISDRTTRNALRMPQFGRAQLQTWRTLEMSNSKTKNLTLNELLPTLEAWSPWRLKMS